MTSDRPVSDEELKEIFEITRRKYAQMRWGDATLEGVKAVRAALQSAAPVPPVVIPEWVDSVVIELHPNHDEATSWDEVVPRITLTGDTIEEALSSLPLAVESVAAKAGGGS